MIIEEMATMVKDLGYPESVEVSREEYENLEEAMSNIPSYELKTDDNGKYIEDDDGYHVYDYDKPCVVSLLFCSTGESRSNLMFKGVKVMARE